jgi:hypothetical protein
MEIKQEQAHLSVVVSSAWGPPVRGPCTPSAMCPPQLCCRAVSCPTLKTTDRSRLTPRHLLPHRTPCTHIRVPLMRTRAARRLPGCLAPPRRCRSPITPPPSRAPPPPPLRTSTLSCLRQGPDFPCLVPLVSATPGSAPHSPSTRAAPPPRHP